MPIRAPLSPQQFAAASAQAQRQGLGFDAFSEHVVITDANAVILYANRAAGEATSFAPEEMLGRNPADLWGGQMPKEFYKKMWQTIKERKEPFVGQVRNVRRDGSEHWQELYIAPLLDPKGAVQYFVGIEYSIPAPPPEKKESDYQRKAAIMFMHSPQSLLLVVAGSAGVVFYRLVAAGLQRIGAVEASEEISKTGVFLHSAGQALATILTHNSFDQTYLFSPPALVASWQTLFKKSGIAPAAVTIGDYSGNSPPQLLQQVHLNLYSAS